VPCKQTYVNAHSKFIKQVYELAPPTCVFKILIDPLILLFLPLSLFIFVSLPLCHQ
jgi:hypothetical protein